MTNQERREILEKTPKEELINLLLQHMESKELLEKQINRTEEIRIEEKNLMKHEMRLLVHLVKNGNDGYKMPNVMGNYDSNYLKHRD